MNKRAIDRDKKSSGPRMRLFCALHPTMDEARLLTDPLDSLEPLPDHRRTVIDQIHMTVLFIGEVARKDLADVKESVERAAVGVPPFCWQPDRIQTLPSRGPVRTMAAVGDSMKSLDELHRRLSQRLARRSNRRAFLPHMTLVRFSPPVTDFEVTRHIEWPTISFARVRLMQSRLLPTGAEHQCVLETSLGQ
ncbi:MAG: 2'-5' RNA ligase family protein [Planctomycetota bacterium]